MRCACTLPCLPRIHDSGCEWPDTIDNPLKAKSEVSFIAGMGVETVVVECPRPYAACQGQQTRSRLPRSCVGL